MGQQLQFPKPSTDNRLNRSTVSDLSRTLERRWFEFDRDTVLRQIDLVQGTIDKNAEELGMVAVEGVFEKMLSDRLLRASRSLRGMAHQLSELRNQIVKSKGASALSKVAS